MKIWPSAYEIGMSELAAWFHPHVRAPGRSERAGSLFVDVVAWYAGAECLFLASALSRLDAGSRIVRFDREAPEDASTLAHAVLVEGWDADDMLSGTAVDVLGRRPLRDLAADLAILGPLEPSVAEAVEAGEFDRHAERVALTVAGCLPWLRPHVPTRFAVADADAYRCLEWVSTNWAPLREGKAGADDRWVASLPALDEVQILGPQPMLS